MTASSPLQHRDPSVSDIGAEAFAVRGSIDQRGGDQAAGAQGAAVTVVVFQCPNGARAVGSG